MSALTPASRLHAIADALSVPVASFYAPQSPTVEDLRRALVAAEQAYAEAVRREAQAVSLAGEK